jgi:hypothetical protein
VGCGVVNSELVAHPPDELLGVQRIRCLDFEPEKLADPDRLYLRKMRLHQVAMDYVPFGVFGGGFVGDHDFDHKDGMGFRGSRQLAMGIDRSA